MSAQRGVLAMLVTYRDVSDEGGREHEHHEIDEACGAVIDLMEVAKLIRDRCAKNIAAGDYRFEHPQAKAQYEQLCAALSRMGQQS